MSIENNLKRIADALEIIAAKKSVGTAPVAPNAEILHQSEPATMANAPAAPSAPKAPAPAAPAPAAPKAPAPAADYVISPEVLNTEIVKEYTRLVATYPDAQARILTIMKAPPFNADNVQGLSVDQYEPLLTAIRAVK